MNCVPSSDFAAGANQWSLDAINVTDFGGGRTVDYDGEGVYVAVLDTGLFNNWREYFPEERIDTVHARAFGGGGGERGNISEPPDKWEHDTDGHGTGVTSVILGFKYSGPEQLPEVFNGVAPKATIIPLKVGSNNHGGRAWSSVGTRAIVYLTDLKISGALGNAPVVLNVSSGGPSMDVVEKAATDFAIANGIVYVSIAHNHGANGMTFPGAYAPVISTANAGWVNQYPPDDPTLIDWIERDVPEGDASQFFIAPNSGYELPGQDLDIAAPGSNIPVPFSSNGQVDYSFANGTSIAGPHVAGVVALMLQKNPALTPSQIEQILESTALPLAPGCADITIPIVDPGYQPTWSHHDNVSFIDITTCWSTNVTGHGLLQADAALAATPQP
jgi:subtilisin family serine protease